MASKPSSGSLLTSIPTSAPTTSFDNPPSNDSERFRTDDDVRWRYGVPPRGNANFAWVQHFIHDLAPHGMAGFVLVRFWFW